MSFPLLFQGGVARSAGVVAKTRPVRRLCVTVHAPRPAIESPAPGNPGGGTVAICPVPCNQERRGQEQTLPFSSARKGMMPRQAFPELKNVDTTTRKPLLSLRLSVSLSLRAAQRTLLKLLPNEPPRTTRRRFGSVPARHGPPRVNRPLLSHDSPSASRLTGARFPRSARRRIHAD